jgi:hypothetical protein
VHLGVDAPAHDGDKVIGRAPLEQVLVGKAGVGDDGAYQVWRRGRNCSASWQGVWYSAGGQRFFCR